MIHEEMRMLDEVFTTPEQLHDFRMEIAHASFKYLGVDRDDWDIHILNDEELMPGSRCTGEITLNTVKFDFDFNFELNQMRRMNLHDDELRRAVNENWDSENDCLKVGSHIHFNLKDMKAMEVKGRGLEFFGTDGEDTASHE